MSFFCFNLGWWACALGASHGHPWIGPLLAPLWVGLHIFYSPYPRGETVFLIFLCFFGFAVDTVLIHLGLFAPRPMELFAPLWLVTMWVLLGMTFESMRMMKKNRWLLCLSGAVSGPLSYYCTEAVNILHYARPLWFSLAVHALFWAALTPALLKLRDWILMKTRVSEFSGLQSASEHLVPAAVRLAVVTPPSATPTPPDKPERPSNGH